MLLQLVLPVKPFVAHVAVERSFVDHAVLYQVRTGRKFLIAHVTGIGSVSKVKILVFHQDMFVAEPSLANVTLVRLFSNMGKPDVPDEAILVAELLLAQGAMKRPSFAAGFGDGLDVFRGQVSVGVVIVSSFCR